MNLYKYKDFYPKLGSNILIQEGSRIQGNVTIEDNVSIWFNTTIRADVCSVTIKKNSNIQELTTIHGDVNANVLIGTNVTIGHNCIIHGCEIGDNSLIGMGSILLNNCKIGKNCLVGAGSLVTQKSVFEEGSLIMGSPAKLIRKLSDEEILTLKEHSDNYLLLAHEHLANNNE